MTNIVHLIASVAVKLNSIALSLRHACAWCMTPEFSASDKHVGLMQSITETSWPYCNMLLGFQFVFCC